MRLPPRTATRRWSSIVGPRIVVGACLVVSAGCGLNTSVLQKGANGRMGCLLNYSCGASPCDPIDPNKPTIVVTHGWNPLPNRIRCTFGPASACTLKERCGDSYNLLSWDWNGVRVTPWNDEPIRIGRRQGRMMAAALRQRGVDPERTQIIAHSLGTLAAAQAALCLAQEGGCVAQLTLLDPPEKLHDVVFKELNAPRHARVVENYWAPGVSGYGAPVCMPGVRNYKIPGATPVWGLVDMSMNNHVHVMRWYYETIRCPSMDCGFQNSVFVCRCGGEHSSHTRPAIR